MTPTVLKIRASASRMQCSACGATAKAACDCGAPYVPARLRAAAALAAEPGKSNRAIADAAGVGKDTVRRERKATGASAPVAPRIGKDGKTRRMPTKHAAYADEPEPGIEDEIDAEDPENFRTAYFLRVEQAIRFAAYSKGPISKDLAVAAHRVAAAW